MHVRYRVELTEEERDGLTSLTRKGKPSARKVERASILLMSDSGMNKADIARSLPASVSTVYRTRRRFVEEGLQAALTERRRPGGERKLDGNEEALLVALACSKAPEGASRWTLERLTEPMIELTEHTSLSTETVRRRLVEKEIKPWQKKMGCIPKFDADFVAHMQALLDLYAEPHNPKRPVVCFDEAFKQLVEETREPIPCKPGQPQRYDYEYRRAGTANIFLFLDRHRGWRKAKPTEHKGNADFSECMRDLVDTHDPDAEVVRVILDNLSTHRPAALYKTFPPEEARRILRRLELHYTPKHASWLNMVEIEIGVMNRMCLNRRIANHDTLARELAAWETRRNIDGATIRWMFNVDDARRKLAAAYPLLRSESL